MLSNKKTEKDLSPKHSKSKETSVNINQPMHDNNPQSVKPAAHSPTIDLSPPLKERGPTTRITVKYDVGFNNSVHLRGEGANLSWDKGVKLKNIKSDEWSWETNIPFSKCEFKVLINDRQYELGENHKLICGTSYEFTPSFHNIC